MILEVYDHFKNTWTVVEVSENFKRSLNRFETLVENSGVAQIINNKIAFIEIFSNF